MAKKSKKNKNEQKIEQEIIESENNIQDLAESSGPFSFIYNNKKLSFILMSIVIAVSAFSLYQKTLDYDIVYCDDNIFVHDYKDFNKDIGNIWESFDRTFGTSYYRPVLGMSFVIDAWIGQKFFAEEGQPGNLNPAAYQLANNIYHILGSLLVFWFLVYLRYDIIGSFLLSLIFTLHPVLTPAAAWISGRNDSMTTIFILLSFLTVLKFYRTKDVAQKYIWYFIHLIIFATSLFTKETSVMFTVLVVVYNLFFREGISSRKGEKYRVNWKKFFSNENWLLAGGWTVVFFIWMNFKNDAFLKIGNNPDQIGFASVLDNYPQIFAIIGKMFFPVKMLALPTFEFFSIASGILVIVTLVVLALKIKDVRKRKMSFGLVWLILFIVPPLFIRIAYVDDFFDYAEHRAYLLLVGMFIVLLELFKGMKINFNKWGTVSVFLSIAVIFAFKASSYTNTFDGAKNFWGNKTYMEPQTSRGYLDLGMAYQRQGELNEADSLFQLGIERNPDNVNFYINLTSLELRRKDLIKAEKYGKRAVQLKPNDKKVQYLYAMALFNQGKFAESIDPLNKAIRLGGAKNVDILHRMAMSLHNTKRYDEALKYYQAAFNLNSKDHQLMTNYGTLLTLVGQNEKGEQLMRASISKMSSVENSYVSLFSYYFRSNQLAKVKELSDLAMKNKVKLRPQIENNLKKIGIRK